MFGLVLFPRLYFPFDLLFPTFLNVFSFFISGWKGVSGQRELKDSDTRADLPLRQRSLVMMDTQWVSEECYSHQKRYVFRNFKVSKGKGLTATPRSRLG